jgi:hypothetical protein
LGLLGSALVVGTQGAAHVGGGITGSGPGTGGSNNGAALVAEGETSRIFAEFALWAVKWLPQPPKSANAKSKNKGPLAEILKMIRDLILSSVSPATTRQTNRIQAHLSHRRPVYRPNP